jgi:hypothetical protein
MRRQRYTSAPHVQRYVVLVPGEHVLRHRHVGVQRQQLHAVVREHEHVHGHVRRVVQHQLRRASFV